MNKINKKTTKLLLSITMVFAMAFTVIPTNVFASEKTMQKTQNKSNHNNVTMDLTEFPEPKNSYKSGQTANLSKIEVGDRLEIGVIIKNNIENINLQIFFVSYEAFTTNDYDLGAWGNESTIETNDIRTLKGSYPASENSDVKGDVVTRAEWIVHTKEEQNNIYSIYLTSPDKTPKEQYDTTVNTSGLLGATTKFETVLSQGMKLWDENNFKVADYDKLKITITPDSSKSFLTAPTVAATNTTTVGTPVKQVDGSYICEIQTFTGAPVITINGTADVTIGETDKDKVNKAKPLAESVISGITATNATTAENILDAVSTGISSIKGVKVSWKATPTITLATNDKAGSITGTIILTVGNENVEITVNKDINKLVSKDSIVDDKTGVKIEYEDGSTFDSEIKLVVTPKSQEELKQYQDGVDKVSKGMSIGGLYDIKLLKDGVEIQPDGKLKISLALTAEMKEMSDLQVIYIDDNGNVTIIPSKLIDGKLAFVTEHFSYYGVIGKEKATGEILPENPSKPIPPLTENPSKPSSPLTGDTSNIFLYLGTIILSGCLIVCGYKKVKSLKK